MERYMIGSNFLKEKDLFYFKIFRNSKLKNTGKSNLIKYELNIFFVLIKLIEFDFSFYKIFVHF